MSALALADAKTHLNITGTTQDAEVQEFIDAAEATLGNLCGPLSPTAATVRVDGGGQILGLPITPVVSLTSVTPSDAAALTLGDLHVDQLGGIVTYNSGASFDARYYDVAYSAGRAVCPDDLLLAVKELLRHLWQTQRGGQRRPGTGVDDTPPSAAYLLPYRVEQMIRPHLRVTGFA